MKKKAQMSQKLQPAKIWCQTVVMVAWYSPIALELPYKGLAFAKGIKEISLL